MKRLIFLIGFIGIFLQGCAQPTQDSWNNGIEWSRTYIGGIYSEFLQQPLMVSREVL